MDDRCGQQPVDTIEVRAWNDDTGTSKPLLPPTDAVVERELKDGRRIYEIPGLEVIDGVTRASGSNEVVESFEIVLRRKDGRENEAFIDRDTILDSDKAVSWEGDSLSLAEYESKGSCYFYKK